MWARLEIKCNTSRTLFDSASLGNIVSVRFYQCFPSQPTPRPPSPEEGLIFGHNMGPAFLGKVALAFAVNGSVFSHPFYVIPNIPLDNIVESALVRPH